MLSFAMIGDMNRSEQENLYRTSRKLSLVPSACGNLLERRTSSSRNYDSGSSPQRFSDDLVLSVLKSPINHVTTEAKEVDIGPSPGSEDELCIDTPEDDIRFKSGGSEDELTECEPMERLPFLHRLRGHRMPRFGEAHHKRVPTPLKRRQRFLRNNKAKDVIAAEDVVDEEDVEDAGDEGPRGVPDPYYPIYLPIDQAFKTKYVFHHKKGKTCQERTYVFLEHPGGWLCFIYHFTVTMSFLWKGTEPHLAGSISY